MSEYTEGVIEFFAEPDPDDFDLMVIGPARKGWMVIGKLGDVALPNGYVIDYRKNYA